MSALSKNCRRSGIKVSLTSQVTSSSELVGVAMNTYDIVDDSADEIAPLSYWVSKPDVAVNLFVMILVWLITVFDFYLINFLMNTFSQIFYSTIASGVSEFFAQAFGGYLFEQVGAKKSMFTSYIIAAVGGFFMLFYGLAHQEDTSFLVLVLIMKFGIASAFNITYIAHTGCFPTLFSTSALGLCTFLCRVFTAASPVIAAMDQTLSVVIFATTSLLGAFIVLALRDINEEDYEYDAKSFKQSQAIKKDN